MKHLLFLLLLVVPIARASDHPVMEGVSALSTGGNPASLVVWGDATPLLVREDGRVFAAATTIGGGRVIALGHTGYFDSEHGDTERFLKQAITWLARDDQPAHVYGMDKARLDALGANATSVDALDDANVLVGSAQDWHGRGMLEDVRAFVEHGGGLLLGECAWGQLQLERAESVEDLAANRLLVEHGVMYTDRVEGSTNANSPQLTDIANASGALRALEQGEDVEMAARVVGIALQVVPDDCALMRQASDLRRAHADDIDAAFATMDERPLTPEHDPLAYALLGYDTRTWNATMGAHPASRAFPGAHDSSAEPVAKAIVIDPSVRAWQSTGLWLPAGGTATLTTHLQRTDPGITLRVGCWLDPQDFDARVRLPEGSRTARVLADDRMHVLTPKASVFSPIGGPVYVEVDRMTSYRDVFEVRITGAIEMPHFVLGETTLDEWNAMMANPSAPWCELESDELVFTLPVERVKQCERPDLVMQHWDRVHRAMDELNPRSPDHWPNGKYRYVADKKLSWGYMYCPQNAPIVIPMTAADEMVDLEQFDAEGPHELWGHYHEMGHAHQSDAWTFGGTGEVTVNIFTVFALHTVNGYPLDSERLRTSPKEAWRRFEEHKANGAPFDEWKRDPFLALQTYAMLWHEFGFEAYRDVFAHYRDGEFNLKNDQDKIDQFVAVFSSVVQRDLTGYFRAWGVPVSEWVADYADGAEPWMPTKPQ